MVEAREVASLLANIRLTDIAPRDVEAEEHARLHLDMDDSELGANVQLEGERQRRD